MLRLRSADEWRVESGEWKVLARLRIEGNELLGGGDDVFIRKDGGAVGFHTEGVDQQRIIGEVDYRAEGHARNA